MRAVFGFLFGVSVGTVLVVGAVATWQRSVSSSPRPRVPSGGALATALPDVSAAPTTSENSTGRFLIARLRDPQQWEELLLVDEENTRALSLPPAVDRRTLPVTDGRRLYAYVRDAQGPRLSAYSLDGQEEETVTDSTPLVQPRGLFASPDGSTVAFFLDDRTSAATELWTYDTAARTKRVTVERLSRAALGGPFFAPDGSFFLRQGTQLLRGSPRRSGTEVLPLEIPSRGIRWEAGAALSPEGSRVALVEEGKVVEYEGSDEEGRVRFTSPFALRLLAWEKPDTLFIEEQLPVPNLWVVRGMEKTRQVLSSLPGEIPSKGAPGEPARRILQYVRSSRRRTATGVEPGPERGVGAVVDRQTFLRTVDTHLRVIVEAPPGEPAAAERVWFVHDPSAAYVDYRVGTTLHRRLIRVLDTAADPPRIAVLGIFAAVGGEWALARGEDLQDPTPVALYEYEADIDRFVEKPLAARPIAR